MSWQCFIDPPGGLLATGHVEMGGIYGHDGALWAASRGMESVLFQDIMDIKNIFFDPKKGFSRGELYIGCLPRGHRKPDLYLNPGIG